MALSRGEVCSLQRVSLLATSLTSASLPPPRNQPSPFTNPGSLLDSSRSLVHSPWSHGDFLISPTQPPASNRTEDNPVVPRQKAFFHLLLLRWGLETISCPIWRGKRQKMKQRSTSWGAISCGRLTGGSCQLFTGKPIPYPNTVFVTFIQTL